VKKDVTGKREERRKKKAREGKGSFPTYIGPVL